MAIPTWVVGQVLSASDVNSWLVPQAAYKPGDTSRASTTTLAADPDLTVPVAANCLYWFEAVIVYDGGTQGTSDISIQWSTPASTTMAWDVNYKDTSGNSVTGSLGLATAIVNAGSNGVNANRSISVRGTIDTASTAGSLTLTWAQNTLSGTATRVRTGSAIIMQRIG